MIIRMVMVSLREIKKDHTCFINEFFKAIPFGGCRVTVVLSQSGSCKTRTLSASISTTYSFRFLSMKMPVGVFNFITVPLSSPSTHKNLPWPSNTWMIPAELSAYKHPAGRVDRHPLRPVKRHAFRAQSRKTAIRRLVLNGEDCGQHARLNPPLH